MLTDPPYLTGLIIGKENREMFEEGYYWLVSERASTRGIAQYLNNAWYLINVMGPVSLYNLQQYGWTISEFIGPANLQK